MKKRTEIKNTTVCSDDYGVTTISTTGRDRHVTRRKPCEQCPWRMDNPTGVFPAEAYRVSAPTAYDGAMHTFACHMSGLEKSATCAGFLLRHADNNVAVRLSLYGERIDLDSISDGGFPIYRTYREMAIANGVDPDDPVLKNIRGNDDEYDHETRGWRPRD